MRIDLNPSSMPELARSNGSANTGKAEEAVEGQTGSTAESAEDVAQLSTGSDAVGALKAQLSSVPEIRQQRVDSLRQAMSDGTFQVSPQRIAESMLSSGVLEKE